MNLKPISCLCNHPRKILSTFPTSFLLTNTTTKTYNTSRRSERPSQSFVTEHHHPIFTRSSSHKRKATAFPFRVLPRSSGLPVDSQAERNSALEHDQEEAHWVQDCVWEANEATKAPSRSASKQACFGPEDRRPIARRVYLQYEYHCWTSSHSHFC